MLAEIADKPLAGIPLVVLDTETTGLYPDVGDRVVEIGAVRLENWVPVAEINHLVQPDRQMSAGASAINGITDEDLIGQPRFSEIATSFLELVDGALLVAHNAKFDASFLSSELLISGYGQTTEIQDRVLPNPWLCTMLLARRCFHFQRNNLAAVAHQLGIGMSQTHRALDDVQLTAEVLKRLEKRLSRHRVQTVQDLLYAQGGVIYTPRSSRLNLPEPIENALAKRLDLLIEYANAQAGTSQRVITPRYVRERRGYVYLIAYCHQKKAQRTFRLDRIRRVIIARKR